MINFSVRCHVLPTGTEYRSLCHTAPLNDLNIPFPRPLPFVSPLFPPVQHLLSSLPTAYRGHLQDQTMDPQSSPSPSLYRYASKAAENTQSEEHSAPTDYGVPKDWKFWCIIFSLGLSVLLTAVEFVSSFLAASWMRTALALKNLDSNALRCTNRPR